MLGEQKFASNVPRNEDVFCSTSRPPMIVRNVDLPSFREISHQLKGSRYLSRDFLEGGCLRSLRICDNSRLALVGVNTYARMKWDVTEQLYPHLIAFSFRSCRL